MQMEYGKLTTRGKGNAVLVESAKMAHVAALCADEKKGKDVRILDIRSISPVADYFVICSGSSTTHTRAIADHIEERLSQMGIPLHHREGYESGRWVLLDYGDLIVHVMHSDEREFYNLERLWGDAREISFARPEAG